MTLLWRGLMQVPLIGHCAVGQDGWCDIEAPFPDRQAVLQPDGMLRLEVRFGDKDPRYSEQRALLTAVNQTTFHEGDEIWIGWLTEYPLGYVQMWPKEDQLADWPIVHHAPGSCLEWHHAPSAGGKYKGDWNKMPQGSAPIYTGINAAGHYLSLVKSIDESVEYKGFSLPLTCGLRNRHVMHLKLSADPAKGLIEYWINGNLLASVQVFTLFPDCDTYLTAGTYRRLTIGDPSLTWPADAKPGTIYPPDFIPKKGQRVFPRDDGYPASLKLGAVLIGTSRMDVEAPAAMPNLQPPPTAQELMDQRAQLQTLLLQKDARILADQEEAIELEKLIKDINTKLDKGPWSGA